MKRLGLTIALMLAMLVPWLAFARGESPKADVDKQVLALTRRVEDLEKRVAQLERAGARANTPVAAPVPAGKAVWRQLKKEMTANDVRKLLGEPKKISTGAWTYWYYSEDTGHSFVKFWQDRVEGWEEPE